MQKPYLSCSICLQKLYLLQSHHNKTNLPSVLMCSPEVSLETKARPGVTDSNLHKHIHAKYFSKMKAVKTDEKT